MKIFVNNCGQIQKTGYYPIMKTTNQAKKTKLNKRDKMRIKSLMRRFGVDYGEAVRMHV